MNRRFIYLTLFTLILCTLAEAQTVRPGDFTAALAQPDSVNGSRVTVTIDPALSNVLNRPQTLEGKEVEGYRVYIYNENYQQAGAEAQQILTRFRELFPDIPAEIIKRRDSSWWKVAVGNCLSRDELMMVYGRVKGAFASAFTTPAAEPLPLKNFLPEPVVPAEAVVEPASELETSPVL
jgi:hypothetical protein